MCRRAVRRYSQTGIQKVQQVFGLVGRLSYYGRVLLGKCLEAVSNGTMGELLPLEDDHGRLLARMVNGSQYGLYGPVVYSE